MGMFKDLRKMSQQGKEMKEQAGYGGIGGSFRQMKDGIGQASSALDEALDMQAAQALLQTGVPGTGKITAMTQGGAMINYQPVIEFDLEVTVEGKDPYAVKHKEAVAQMLLPQVQPGKTVAVKVDPADPSRLAIDWAGAPIQ
jgi:hypothetical protein